MFWDSYIDKKYCDCDNEEGVLQSKHHLGMDYFFSYFEIKITNLSEMTSSQNWTESEVF